MNTRNRTPAQHAFVRELAHRRGWIGCRANDSQPSAADLVFDADSKQRALLVNLQMYMRATGKTEDEARRELGGEYLT